MIKSNTEKHTISWLYRKATQGLLNHKITIQRKEVWDSEHKSNLICSVLLGIPIESLLFEEERKGDGYKVLDGQQRDLSFIRYIGDEYAISKKVIAPVINDVDIVDKKFSELPKEMQEAILDCELSISVMRPLTDEERILVFFMRNQSVPLSKLELTRVALGTEILKELEFLIEHPFLTQKSGMAYSAINRYQNLQVVLECLVLLSGKDYGFSGKEINIFSKELNQNGVSAEAKQVIKDSFDYLNEAFEEKNVSLKKIHLAPMIKVSFEAMRTKTTPIAFKKWAEMFFADLADGNLPEYASACESGSAKKPNVEKRLQIMQNHFIGNYRTANGVGGNN